MIKSIQCRTGSEEDDLAGVVSFSAADPAAAHFEILPLVVEMAFFGLIFVGEGSGEYSCCMADVKD